MSTGRSQGRTERTAIAARSAEPVIRVLRSIGGCGLEADLRQRSVLEAQESGAARHTRPSADIG